MFVHKYQLTIVYYFDTIHPIPSFELLSSLACASSFPSVHEATKSANDKSVCNHMQLTEFDLHNLCPRLASIDLLSIGFTTPNTRRIYGVQCILRVGVNGTFICMTYTT